jgi:hypothetical protein
MALSKRFQGLAGGFTRSSGELRQSLSDGSQGLGAVQALEQSLIAIGVLHDKFCASIHRQHERGPAILQAGNVVLHVSLEVGHWANLTQVDHVAS